MVFLMSRIREEHVHGLDTRAAVEHGISAIGRVVVAAALIMGTVFAAFILSADRIPKEFGILLAVAILTDALIVRMTLVPAFLTLLGEKSWYIPRWLDRILPNITIEPPHDGEAKLPLASSIRRRLRVTDDSRRVAESRCGSATDLDLAEPIFCPNDAGLLDKSAACLRRQDDSLS